MLPVARRQGKHEASGQAGPARRLPWRANFTGRLGSPAQRMR
jgi:hypothetical protein